MISFRGSIMLQTRAVRADATLQSLEQLEVPGFPAEPGVVLDARLGSFVHLLEVRQPVKHRSVPLLHERLPLLDVFLRGVFGHRGQVLDVAQVVRRLDPVGVVSHPHGDEHPAVRLDLEPVLVVRRDALAARVVLVHHAVLDHGVVPALPVVNLKQQVRPSLVQESRIRHRQHQRRGDDGRRGGELLEQRTAASGRRGRSAGRTSARGRAHRGGRKRGRLPGLQRIRGGLALVGRLDDEAATAWNARR
mmetsp:Transcript_3079/g.12155  ORF Transcript_3079/g.12155 Transcript_3079/m.12155 type:complete len:248 (-) Transcript_3079:177-920(-)